jgi:hypothetical protein
MEEALPILETAKAMASVSGDPASQLTEMQLGFAAEFIANGGKGKLAAELAGYSHADVAACRLLTNPRVLALIKRLAQGHADAALTVAIRTLVQCCNDATASWKDRRAAAMDLAKLGGNVPKEGPSVAVQVNVGSDQPASAVLQSVWKERAERLSGIAAPMQDSDPSQVIVNHDGDPPPSRAAGRGGAEL